MKREYEIIDEKTGLIYIPVVIDRYIPIGCGG